MQGQGMGHGWGWVSFQVTIAADTELVIITCMQAPVESTFLGKAAPQTSSWDLQGPGLTPV